MTDDELRELRLISMQIDCIEKNIAFAHTLKEAQKHAELLWDTCVSLDGLLRPYRHRITPEDWKSPPDQSVEL